MLDLIILEHLLIYWGLSTILLKYGGHKVNPPPKVVAVVLFNQCVVGYAIPNILGVDRIPPHENTTSVSIIPQIPLYLFTYYVLHCIWFYFIHRLLHTRFLWRHIHYIHHSYINTNPYATFYAHPVEHLMLNLMSVLIGPYMFPSNTILLRVWLHAGTINSIISHNSSGNSGVMESHDIHHKLFRFNFGTGVAMDKIFGTYMKPINNS
jgi:sterol desaturase/sphingolipid hydroxylase (fatty acid hydroxylase superfamily)